jgi:hypothetical protein
VKRIAEERAAPFNEILENDKDIIQEVTTLKADVQQLAMNFPMPGIDGI